MSIAVTSSSTPIRSLLDGVLGPVTTSSTSQATSNRAIKSSTTSNLANSSSQSSIDALTQDVVALLKVLSSGDTTGAKADLAKLQKDIKAGSSAGQAGVTKDFTSLTRDLALGNVISVKSDLTQLTTDLTVQSSDTATDMSQSELEKLVSKLSELLNSGSTNGALQAVVSHLVQQGLGTGSLVDTSA